MPSNIRPRDLVPDPILTGFSVQYGQGDAFIADQVATPIPFNTPYYKIPTYKRSDISLEIEDRVGPSGRPNQFRVLPPTFATGSTIRRGLDYFINDELRLSPVANPLADEQAAVQMLTHTLRLGIETRIKAKLDAVVGTHSASPSVKWDASSGTIAVEKNFDDAREAFLLQIGFEANIAIIPPTVSKVAKRDPSIRELRKYTDPSLLVNGDLPPTLWGLRTLIPGAIQNTANPGLAQTVARVWATDNVYLAYVNPSIAGNLAAMTALCQPRWSAWGTPFQAYRWREPHQSQRGTWVSVDVHQAEETICQDAIYVMNDVLS